MGNVILRTFNAQKCKIISHTTAMIDHYRKLYANYMTRHDLELPSTFSSQSGTPQYITEAQFSQIHSISKDIISRSTYSLLPYYFLSAEIPTQIQDIVVSKQNTGNCVSFAHMIIADLRDKGIHTGVIIPATLPSQLILSGYPLFAHVVVMLETETNFILFEPTYFITEPIVIPKNGTDLRIKIHIFNAEWIYKYIDETNTILVTNLDGNELFFYSIAEIANPSQSVSYPTNIMNNRIPIVKFDPVINKKIAHLTIRIDTKKLEGYGYDGVAGIRYERFDWSNISEWTTERSQNYNELRTSLREWEGLSITQCNAFGYNQIDLVDMIIAIILENNKNGALLIDRNTSSEDEYSF
jgi:hypothetical protein